MNCYSIAKPGSDVLRLWILPSKTQPKQGPRHFNQPGWDKSNLISQSLNHRIIVDFTCGDEWKRIMAEGKLLPSFITIKVSQVSPILVFKLCTRTTQLSLLFFDMCSVTQVVLQYQCLHEYISEVSLARILISVISMTLIPF